ncbi:MAG: alpha/beta hydrolase, partial [Lysobacterales bacterium]
MTDRGGASGYIYDRESGEFTVHHLKNLIRSLSGTPEIKRIHMYFHSNPAASSDLILLLRYGLAPGAENG